MTDKRSLSIRSRPIMKLRNKEQELKAMKEFTGSPKINERSQKMVNSNISQLTKLSLIKIL